MSLKDSMAPSPAHWSKDFVEHLRTVHFALIGVSIGLVLIVLSAKPYNPSVALRQIHQIIELKKVWSLKWIMWRGAKKEAPESDNSTSGSAINETVNLAAIGRPVTWGNDPLLPAPSPDSLSPDLDSLGNLPISEHDAFSAAVTPVGGSNQASKVPFSIEQYWAQEHVDPDWSPEAFPSTLFDFRQWWNALQQQHGYRAVFPRSLYESGGRCFTVSGTSYVSSPEIGPSIGSDSVELTLHTSKEALTYEGISPFGLCFFPVRRFVYVEVSQQMIADQFRNWKTGTFNAAFSDLSLAARDFETLELDDVEKFISTEAAKGSDVFEAFGMKFPAGHITWWGMIVLLGVQLYFFIYLKQLSGKLAETDAGWDVPWIGLNNSFLAKSIFFLTAVLLPCIAMSFPGFHSISQMEKPIVWKSLAVAQAVGATAMLVPAILIAVLSWRYRPNVPGSHDHPNETQELSGSGDT